MCVSITKEEGAGGSRTPKIGERFLSGDDEKKKENELNKIGRDYGRE